LLEDEVLLVVEAIVLQADGVFDHVAGLAFIFLRRDVEVRPAAKPDHLATFEFRRNRHPKTSSGSPSKRVRTGYCTGTTIVTVSPGNSGIPGLASSAHN